MGTFSLILLGEVISFLGTGLTNFGIGVRIFQDSQSVTHFALVALSTALPLVVLSPFAGVMADRYDRRWLLILGNVGSAVCSLALFRLAAGGALEPWHVYPLIAASSSFAAFIWPSLSAATTMLVGKEHFGRASGMLQTGSAMAEIAAPAMAGVLLDRIGLSGLILVDLGTFLFAAGTLIAVRIPPPPPSEAGRGGGGGMRDELLFGWRFIRAHRGLLHLLALFSSQNFCLGLVQALITPLVLSFASATTLGLVLSIASSGLLAGGLLMSVWGGSERRIRAILTVMLGQGLLLLMGGLQPSATLIASAAFFFLFGVPVIIGSSQALWQSKVPPDIQGRVFATRRMIGGSGLPLALALAGPLADHLFEPLMAPGGALAASAGRLIGVGPGRGIGLMLMVVGGLMALAVAVAARSRALRRIEEEMPDAVEPEAASGAAAAAEAPGLEGLGWIPALVLLATLGLGAAAALAARRPPEPVAATAPPTVFSSERAMRDVEILASRPRPLGSPAHREARRYLVSRLQALGLEVALQRADSKLRQGSGVVVASVANLLARLPGTEGRRQGAVLLVAHYDSVKVSPGAADNAAAVATLLETARALRAGPPLARDVLLLLSDGEEVGLHGARAFVAEHPWARQVGVVLNFEGRGCCGPVYMFRTGGDGGTWIPAFLAAAPRPLASSLMAQMARLLPNDTDFSVLLEAGYPGFDFAFIEGLSHYHTPLDRPESLDPATLQHQGEQALALTRRLAGSPPAPVGGPEPVYFNLWGPLMVSYPRWLAGLGALAVTGLLLAVVSDGLRRARLSPFGIGQAFLGILGMLVVLPIGVTLAWFVLRDVLALRPIGGGFAEAGLFRVAFTMLAASGGLLLLRFLGRIAGELNLAAGALIWGWIAMAAASGLALPLASNFLWLWPLAGGVLALGYLLRVPWPLRPARATAVLAAAALPGLALVVPATAELYVALQGVAELSGAALVPAVLWLATLAPQGLVMTGRRSWGVPALLALVGGGLLALAVAGSHRRPIEGEDSVLYALDLDTSQATWFSFDAEPDGWTRQFGFAAAETGTLDRFYPPARRAILSHPAPLAELPGPELAWLERDGPEGVRLGLRNRPGCRARALWFEPAEAVAEVWIGRVRIGPDGRGAAGGGAEAGADPPRVIVRLAPEGPVEEVRVVLRGGGPVRAVVVEQAEGLPGLPDLEPRPSAWLPRDLYTFLESDVSLVRRSFPLGDHPTLK